jgi:hypothetical protein
MGELSVVNEEKQKRTSIFPLNDLASSFGNCVLEGKDGGKTNENGMV